MSIDVSPEGFGVDVFFGLCLKRDNALFRLDGEIQRKNLEDIEIFVEFEWVFDFVYAVNLVDEPGVLEPGDGHFKVLGASTFSHGPIEFLSSYYKNSDELTVVFNINSDDTQGQIYIYSDEIGSFFIKLVLIAAGQNIA